MTEPTNIPPAPSSLVWPTMLIPRKLTVSVGERERDGGKERENRGRKERERKGE